MSRDSRYLGQLPFWRGRRWHIIVVLIASIPMWLSPSALFASVVTHTESGNHAKPARRGIGSLDSLLPARQMELFGPHMASEPEESAESESQLEDSVVDTLPDLRLQHNPMISRIGAVNEQARLSVLQSRGLPLIC